MIAGLLILSLLHEAVSSVRIGPCLLFCFTHYFIPVASTVSGTHGGSVPCVTWMSTEINRWTMNKQTWMTIHSGPQLPQMWTEGSDKTVSFIVTTKLFFSFHVCITTYKPCLCLEYIHSAFVENWKCKAKRWRLCPQDISNPITNSDKFIMMQSADNSAVKLWRDAGLCPTILEETLAERREASV